MGYRYILFDADGTLFDYDRAEAAALTEAWRRCGLPPDDRLLPTYREINGALWRDFERGRLPQAHVPRLRFERLLEALEAEGDPMRVGGVYLRTLARQTQLLDGARELVRSLRTRYRLALVTNGLAEVQRPRLARSALADQFPVVVISGEIGAAKPDPAFFDHTFEQLGRPPREQVLIVGDSLTSDIAGGQAYGIDTCWLRAGDEPLPASPPTFVIQRLAELPELLARRDSQSRR